MIPPKRCPYGHGAASMTRVNPMGVGSPLDIGGPLFLRCLYSVGSSSTIKNKDRFKYVREEQDERNVFFLVFSYLRRS